MPIALERIMKAVETIEFKGTEEGIAEKWLGAFEGVVPEGMTSTEYIKKLRESCYGKFYDFSGSKQTSKCAAT